MTHAQVDQLRVLADAVSQTPGSLLLVTPEDPAVIEVAKALLNGGTVTYKTLGEALYYIADMAE